MKKFCPLLLLFPVFMATAQVKKTNNAVPIEKIKSNQYFAFVKNKALEVMKTGFNAGDGYREVWIRDYNTFIELAAGHHHPSQSTCKSCRFGKQRSTMGYQ